MLTAAIAINEESEMPQNSDWNCWDITGCVNEKCCVRDSKDRACWEIAQEMEDYRKRLNVCADCLVYLTKQKNAVLSEDEITEILKKKGVCVLAEKCQEAKG